MTALSSIHLKKNRTTGSPHRRTTLVPDKPYDRGTVAFKNCMKRAARVFTHDNRLPKHLLNHAQRGIPCPTCQQCPLHLISGAILIGPKKMNISRELQATTKDRRNTPDLLTAFKSGRMSAPSISTRASWVSVSHMAMGKCCLRKAVASRFSLHNTRDIPCIHP